MQNVLSGMFILFLIAGSAFAQERAIEGTGFIPGMVINLQKEKQFWFTTRWYPERSRVVEIRKNGDVVFSDGYMIQGGVPLVAVPKNVTMLNGQKELVQFWKNFHEKN
jgi:hypothetical protein